MEKIQNILEDCQKILSSMKIPVVDDEGNLHEVSLEKTKGLRGVFDFKNHHSFSDLQELLDSYTNHFEAEIDGKFVYVECGNLFEEVVEKIQDCIGFTINHWNVLEGGV